MEIQIQYENLYQASLEKLQSTEIENVQLRAACIAYQNKINELNAKIEELNLKIKEIDNEGETSK